VANAFPKFAFQRPLITRHEYTFPAKPNNAKTSTSGSHTGSIAPKATDKGNISKAPDSQAAAALPFEPEFYQLSRLTNTSDGKWGTRWIWCATHTYVLNRYKYGVFYIDKVGEKDGTVSFILKTASFIHHSQGSRCSAWCMIEHKFSLESVP
jgi:hypothetical protein